MYVRNEILVFQPGRGKEALDRLNWIHSLMVPFAGFKQAIVAKYLGDASRHTIMRFWQDIETYNAFRETPDGHYGQSKPEGIYDSERVVNPLLSFNEVTGKATGNFLLKVQSDVAPEAWNAYTQFSKDIADIGAALPGLVWSRQLREMDGDRSIAVVCFSSRKDLEDLVESPKYVELMSKRPSGVQLVRTECFEIVSNIGPK